jgi:hypothetical protein
MSDHRPMERSRIGSSLASVAIACVLTATSCGPGAIVLDVSSPISSIDSLSFTVLGSKGALLVAQRLPENGSPLRLPGTVQLLPNGRSESVDVMAWGFRALDRVAYGALHLELSPVKASRLPLELGPPVSDLDADEIPDERDDCPRVFDPNQEGSAGRGDACAMDACLKNLIVNPGFEVDVSSWRSSGGVLSRIAGGSSGAFAARACHVSGLYTINDEPNTIARAAPGTTYQLEAQVRSTVPQNVRPRLRELTPGGGEVGHGTNSGITTTSQWQTLSVTYTVQGPEPSAVEVYFSSVDAPTDACFELDDVCLRRLP